MILPAAIWSSTRLNTAESNFVNLRSCRNPFGSSVLAGRKDVTPMKKVSNFLYIVGGIFVVLSMVIIIANVIMRGLFNSPIRGAYELISLCAVLFVSVSIPVCTLSTNHITVEFITQKLRRTPKMIAEIFARIIEAAVGLIFTYSGWRLAKRMIEAGESTSSGGIPIGPFRVVWVVCAALMAVFAIYTIFQIPRKYNAMQMGKPEEKDREEEA